MDTVNFGLTKDKLEDSLVCPNPNKKFQSFNLRNSNSSIGWIYQPTVGLCGYMEFWSSVSVIGNTVWDIFHQRLSTAKTAVLRSIRMARKLTTTKCKCTDYEVVSLPAYLYKNCSSVDNTLTNLYHTR